MRYAKLLLIFLTAAKLFLLAALIGGAAVSPTHRRASRHKNVVLQAAVGNGAAGPCVADAGGLSDDLDVYWKLDEDTPADRVDSIDSADLVEGSSQSSVSGIINDALDLEASFTNSLDATDNAALSLGADQAFSIMGWFRLESYGVTTTSRVALSKSDGTNQGTEYQIQWSNINDRWECVIGDDTSGNGLGFCNQAAPTLDTFYHVVCTHDPTNDEIYMAVNDGAVCSSTQTWTGGTFDGANTVRMGNITGSGGVTNWDGLSDRARDYQSL
jgi:hypothetical protein